MISLPAPNSEAIKLRKVEGGIAAAVKFSGKTTEELVRDKEKELRSALLKDGLKPQEGCLLARYNDPGRTWSFIMVRFLLHQDARSYENNFRLLYLLQILTFFFSRITLVRMSKLPFLHLIFLIDICMPHVASSKKEGKTEMNNLSWLLLLLIFSIYIPEFYCSFSS